MKKIIKIIQSILLFALLSFVGILIGSGKDGLSTETLVSLYKSVFDRNLDFMIIGFAVLFIFNTGVAQNFIFKKVKLNFNVDNNFFIYLFFFPLFIFLLSHEFLNIKIFSFLKPLSARPALQIFSFSFVILFTLMYLYSFTVNLIFKAPFFEYCILNSLVISASVSLFMSFFTLLFWEIKNVSMDSVEEVYFMFSLIVFLFASELGSMFKKKEKEQEVYHELE